MTNSTEAHRLKVARTISGLDLRQIAPKLGISYSYMARMEAGTRKITKPVKKWMDKMIDDFYIKQEIDRLSTEYALLKGLNSKNYEQLRELDRLENLRDDFCPCGNLKANESDVCEECL
jgi:hypothetical protein